MTMKMKFGAVVSVVTMSAALTSGVANAQESGSVDGGSLEYGSAAVSTLSYESPFGSLGQSSGSSMDGSSELATLMIPIALAGGVIALAINLAPLAPQPSPHIVPPQEGDFCLSTQIGMRWNGLQCTYRGEYATPKWFRY